MGFADNYLAKYGSGKRYITIPPAGNLKYIVVIPAFNEENITDCLNSIHQCKAVKRHIEVITVINWPYNSDSFTIQKNQEIHSGVNKWIEKNNKGGFSFHCIVAEPPGLKYSGVGFARKSGMDEAILRLNDVNEKEGVLISLDADSAVDQNYFIAIEEHFNKYPLTQGCTIYFEHPLEGEFSPEVYEAVSEYELHLRYYLKALRYAGHPNAFHTVGSAFAVRAGAYCLHGGMNRRQAGEDFYFLQKFFDLGTFSECNTTRVIPSPRPSLRVPFGTGPAIQRFMEDRKEIMTNNPELFFILKSFLEMANRFYLDSKESYTLLFKKLHPLMQSFLEEKQFETRLNEIAENSSTREAFQKRFFRWFNMFTSLKFLNHGKKLFPDVPVKNAARALLKKSEPGIPIPGTCFEMLKIFRKLERN